MIIPKPLVIKNSDHEKKMIMSEDVVTFVSLFYDIGRERWANRFARDHYKGYLIPFREFMKMEYRMIAYIDKTVYQDVLNDLENYPNANIELVPIDEQWMKDNIWAWSKLEREKEIMNDSDYKSKLATSIEQGYPENTKPHYTILTHSKIDVVNYAIENDSNPSDYYMWVDFGYFKSEQSTKVMPKGAIDLNTLDLDRVNLCCVNSIDERDRDIEYTLTIAPEKISAGIFFGNKNVLKEFQNLCHKWLEKFQAMNVADDEQHLWLQCYFENTELFTTHVFNGWYGWFEKVFPASLLEDKNSDEKN
jgi:hypothetical protein